MLPYQLIQKLFLPEDANFAKLMLQENVRYRPNLVKHNLCQYGVSLPLPNMFMFKKTLRFLTKFLLSINKKFLIHMYKIVYSVYKSKVFKSVYIYKHNLLWWTQSLHPDWTTAILCWLALQYRILLACKDYRTPQQDVYWWDHGILVLQTCCVSCTGPRCVNEYIINCCCSLTKLLMVQPLNTWWTSYRIIAQQERYDLVTRTFWVWKRHNAFNIHIILL